MSTSRMSEPATKRSLDADSDGMGKLRDTDEAWARSSLNEAMRCVTCGRLDRGIELATHVYECEPVSIETRLEAAKLCVDWHAATGAYGQCRRVAAHAAWTGQEHVGCAHPLVLMLRNSEAYWLAILGYNDMAHRKFASLIADMEGGDGLDPQISFAIRNNSAMPWKNTGKWLRAARVYRELLADMVEQREETDVTVLTVRDNLAEVLSANRHYEEAIELYETNMDALLTVADRGDWRVLRLRCEIARNVWMGGERERGEDLWTVLAEDCRRYLGDRDALTARVRAILLTLASLRGDDERALSLARKLREDHPDDWDECDVSEVAALIANLQD